MTSLFVVAYDVADDGRRLQLRKVLEGFGVAVQRSVFECYLDERKLQNLLRRVRRIAKEGEDSVRVYRLCSSCAAQALVLGVGHLTELPSVYIV